MPKFKQEEAFSDPAPRAGDVRVTGHVVKLMADKGFGFIADQKGTQYFFHRSAVRDGFDSLELSQPVSFVVQSSPKGPRAENVRRTST